ncbi:cysteine hydrolase family protein [Peribacillus kribbensis]|uniref:cysteine hydrolase family protein n=1 Tax=Peribacillus kribbensis TaxID=356658 RepID=UPI0004272C89|nr:isochorismatase family cysteine hydrolase [Peribacillus kribbensis]
MKVGNKHNYWLVKEDVIDISRGSKSSVTISVEDNKQLTLDPSRAAFIIIDMQNFFCSPVLGRSKEALSLSPAITGAVDSCRKIGMSIAWVNWGNRLDTANLPPSLLYAFKGGKEKQPGIGELLPDNLGASLVKDSWSADVIEELKGSIQPEDWWIDKYRVSGFPGTILDQTLRANGINTLFFAGVNTDQCVMGTIMDAAFLGYDCILLRDCTATTSPSYALEATFYNMKAIGGFITSSSNLEPVTNS